MNLGIYSLSKLMNQGIGQFYQRVQLSDSSLSSPRYNPLFYTLLGALHYSLSSNQPILNTTVASHPLAEMPAITTIHESLPCMSNPL